MKRHTLPWVGTMILILSGGGCATKRHVREALAPLEDDANRTRKMAEGLGQQMEANGQAIGDLDRRVALADEKSAEAVRRSSAALEMAGRAATTAAEAGRRADIASGGAQQAQRSAAETNRRMNETLGNLSNYRLALSEKVYFGFAESELTKEDQAKLDQAVRQIRALKNYVVEVKGYADSTGSVPFNRDLSRKRADAVVHYLVVERRIPLRTVRELGAGGDFPRSDNLTPTARRENRRVEVRVLALEPEGGRPAVADGSGR